MVKIVKAKLQSSLLRRALPLRVILPERYEAAEAGYPALYLLHGLFGSCDNWLELTGLKDYLAEKEFIVVLPEGCHNWYSDSATIESDKFESSFINELIPAVEAEYRISPGREKRAVAGLSMGGFGALKFALKRPDLFVFAGSMSGAFDAPRMTAANKCSGGDDLSPSVLEVFGEADNPSRIENDLFEIIGRIPEAEKISFPSIYLDCGVEDGFLEVNREFCGVLQEKNIAFEYYEAAGGHDWVYWDRRIRVILRKVEEIFSAGEN